MPTSGSGSTTTAGTSDGCDDDPNANPEHICCAGVLIDPRSDRFNCGDCEVACDGETPFCDQGTCGTTPCADDLQCPGTQDCCGAECCDVGMICCTLNGPVQGGPGCVPPSETGNCPAGCSPLCQCTAPDTPIATPTGDRPIASLKPGDLVYSIDQGQTSVVPIAEVQRVPADDHRVIRAVLADGQTLQISASHPLADGRTFNDLRAGQRLGDAVIVDAEEVPYEHGFTHDILPMSSTGTYFVAGIAVATTMPLVE